MTNSNTQFTSQTSTKFNLSLKVTGKTLINPLGTMNNDKDN